MLLLRRSGCRSGRIAMAVSDAPAGVSDESYLLLAIVSERAVGIEYSMQGNPASLARLGRPPVN